MSALRLHLMAVVVALASVSHAQDAHYLVPESFVTAKDSVAVQLIKGSSESPWGGEQVRWVFVKTGMVQENRDDLSGWLTATGSFECPVPGPGPVMLGIDFKPTLETLPPSKLSPLLENKSAVMPSSPRVRHYRSALLLFRSTRPDDDSTIATTEVSLTSSIHPLMDPARFTIGGTMPFELVLRGTEVEGGHVTTFSLRSGKTLVLATGAGGMGSFKPSEGGEHRLTFQVAKPLIGDPEADFELFSTTLTFSLSGGRS